LVAVPAYEEDGSILQEQIAAARGSILVSPLVRFEATLALAGAGRMRLALGTKADPHAALSKAKELVDEYLKEIGASEVGISPEIGDGAINAAMTYGKVVDHRAELNFGDCYSYACAKANGVPLLYKGNDFAQTDLA
jgi:ribonuclease VapC